MATANYPDVESLKLALGLAFKAIKSKCNDEGILTVKGRDVIHGAMQTSVHATEQLYLSLVRLGLIRPYDHARRMHLVSVYSPISDEDVTRLFSGLLTTYQEVVAGRRAIVSQWLADSGALERVWACDVPGMDRPARLLPFPGLIESLHESGCRVKLRLSIPHVEFLTDPNKLLNPDIKISSIDGQIFRQSIEQKRLWRPEK